MCVCVLVRVRVGVCVWTTCSPRSELLLKLQGAGALPGGLLPTKTPPGRGENVPAVVHLGRWTPAGGHLEHLLIASDDGERLSQNPLQILLLCVGKTAIMYAKSVQREDCTSVLLDGFRLSCRLR